MRGRQKEIETFPRRLGKAAKNIVDFSLGLPGGMIMGVMPGIGFIIGGLTINGHLQRDIRYQNEDWHDYESRMEKNKVAEPLHTGIIAGVIIGWVGQIVMLTN